MGRNWTTNEKPKKRTVLIAHCFDADKSMESRLSWFRAVQSAELYDTTVVCASAPEDCLQSLPSRVRENLQVLTVPHKKVEKWLFGSTVFFYIAYRIWHRRVFRVLEKIHAESPFDLVHQVSYCGFREPGEGWRLGAKFFWGPIGGTQNIPWRFLRELDVFRAAKEVCRAAVNQWQMYYSLRVGRALRASTTVLSANTEVQQSLQQARGVKTGVQLETGIEEIAASARPLRDSKTPLKILWAGRLESWKGLSLLLKALAAADFPYQLRVLGSGSYSKRWRRQASNLGLEHVEWVDLPRYDRREEHYQWADVLVFTSLRDTSGTGLLESLAAGVPIVALDHQGARDIMTSNCAVRIPVTTPQQVAASIRLGLSRLAANPVELQRLSAGAISRARLYHWDRLGEEMLGFYRDALGEKVADPQLKSCPATEFLANKSPDTVAI